MEEIEYGPLTLKGKETLTIIDCEKDAVRVEIPATVDGRPVVAHVAENPLGSLL